MNNYACIVLLYLQTQQRNVLILEIIVTYFVKTWTCEVTRLTTYFQSVLGTRAKQKDWLSQVY